MALAALLMAALIPVGFGKKETKPEFEVLPNGVITLIAK